MIGQERNEYQTHFLRGLDKIGTDPKSIFVILPFTHTLVFDAVIKPAAASAGYSCKKADDFFRTGAVMENIAKNIKRSELILADLTDRNANVFYELGIAHALHKPVALITQDENDVPTDLKSFIYYPYDVSNSEGIAKLQRTVTQILQEAQKEPEPIKIVDIDSEIRSEYGNDKAVSSEFLDYPDGSVSLWSYASRDFLETAVNRYLMAHCGNDGKVVKISICSAVEEEGKPKVIDGYLNAFAIRITKHGNKPKGHLAFWCSNSKGFSNVIDCNCDLAEGWHLFTVTWSREKGFIRFFVDTKCAGSTVFHCWPDSLEKNVILGTWPNRHSSHYANAKLGKLLIFNQALECDAISKLYKECMPEASA